MQVGFLFLEGNNFNQFVAWSDRFEVKGVNHAFRRPLAFHPTRFGRVLRFFQKIKPGRSLIGTLIRGTIQKKSRESLSYLTGAEKKIEAAKNQ